MGSLDPKAHDEGFSIIETLDFIEQTCKESKVIVIGCLVSWALCRLNFRFVWLILVLAICRTHYQVTIRRVERTIRDELLRYHASKKLQHGESVEWINGVLGRLWHLYQRRICDYIVRYVNSGLERPGAEMPAEKLVIHSIAVMEIPLRFLKFTTYSKPRSRNLIIEGQFRVEITPPYNHGLHLLDRANPDPLIDMTVVHNKQDRKQHDLAVQVKQFTGLGVMRVEIDFDSVEPHILKPQIELQDQPHIDCTMRTVSQHHFPFHFAHQVDWRKVVEVQIREGLGWAFNRPLPLPFHLLGERLVMRMMTWWWHLDRACHD